MHHVPEPLLSIDDLRKSAAFVAGQWIAAASGATVAVTNPADDTVLGHVPDLGAVEVTRAIAAATDALPAWRARPATERAALLKRWNALILAHKEPLARILTEEQGKPLPEALGEIIYGASFVEWFAEEAPRITGEVLPSPRAGGRIIVQKHAVGVCALIIPWNFPNALFLRKAAAALAAGCTVVIKPSEFTPFSALALAEVARLSGIPDGVLNVVTGMPQEIGRTLMESPYVRKLSFTGSTRVGKMLLAQTGGTVKKASLELGGNAPLIVFDDADIDRAIDGCVASKFRNNGQTCVCANRIFVQAGIHDAFVARLKAAVETMKVGPGTEEGVSNGPLINDAAIDKVERHVADALAKGAMLVIGGERLHGRFYRPTILIGADETMELAHDETFGPVAAIFRFDTEAEVIAAANSTPYGLAAYFFTRDADRMFRVADALETGMIGINEGLISNAIAPFGGVKESGLGREGSTHGIEEYLEMKTLTISSSL
jgi:succinate-semialdehyde dehydrogenase/glutarate-semialdehyde dehydrogenase